MQADWETGRGSWHCLATRPPDCEKLLAEFQFLGLLRRVPIFEQFNGDQLRRVSKQLERFDVLKGEVICKQGGELNLLLLYKK
jgi:hypothetical protein